MRGSYMFSLPLHFLAVRLSVQERIRTREQRWAKGVLASQRRLQWPRGGWAHTCAAATNIRKLWRTKTGWRYPHRG